MDNFLYRHKNYLKYLLVLSFITFVILVAAPSAQGACLTIDAQTTGTTASNTDSSMTVSHTTGSGSDRLMLVGISVNVNDNETVTGVTYGGTALTKVGEQANGNDAMVYIYRLIAPNPGTADVVINFSSALNYGAIAGVMTFSGVHQTTPLGAFASAIGDDTATASVDIASAPGELVFGVVTCEYDPINAAVTGQEVQWNTTTDNGNYGAGGTDSGASPTVTMTWGFETAATIYNHWAIGGVSIKPAGTKNLVMVTIDGTTTTDGGDTSKRTLFESWGWTVTAIDDDAAQGTYDTAAANNDVMYISESCASSSVGTKAALLDVGIVVEENFVWDQMRFLSSGSGDRDLDHTTINISNDSHYITSTLGTGDLVLYSSIDNVGNLTAGSTLASGGVLLANETLSPSPALFYFETGAALSTGTAANRRVAIPTSSSNPGIWYPDTETLVQRSLDWASGCGGGAIPSCGTDLVMVVGTDDSQPYDAAKQTLFEGWGWTVTTINDYDSQTVYDNAAANNDVMYISESTSSGSVNTKARDLNIGIVDDECWVWDEMEYGSTGNGGGDWGTTINITDDSHYITSTVSTGNLSIYNSGANINNLPSSLASGGQLLGQTSASDPTLFTFDTGATLDSGTAANRRVGFPSFDSNPSNWTTNLETLLQRSLEWAAGCGAGGGSTNSDPVLDAIGNKSVDEGQLLEFTISATDPDTGDTLTYSASNLPTGASFDPATQTFSWTPGVGDAGTYPNVLFTVDDDGTPQGSDSEGITITVNASGGGGFGTPITPGDVAGYSCNMKITIDNTKVAFTSENFPVLISITDDSLKTSGCGFVTDPDGDDIVFTNSALTLQLYHEIEKYDAATGEFVAWVLVPSLSGSTDTDIYMYFGDSNVTTPTENPTDVWDSDYVGVWHLYDTSGDTQDSTSYNTDGVVSGTVTRGATGQIGDAFNFGTNGEVDWGDPADGHLDFGTGEMTLSLWVNMDNHRGAWEQIILKGKSSWQPGYQIEVNASANNFYFTINDGSHSEWGVASNISFSLDTWTHVVGVVDRSNNLLRAYKNGVQVDTSDISTVGSINVGDVLTIGRDTWGWPDALIEEVRLSRVARSAEWIQTSYSNQNDPSSFYSVEKNCPSTVPPIAEFTCSIPITIDSSKVSGTSDLVDFPVLISLTNTSLKTTGSCGYVQNSNGYDIIFSDATQTTVLDHEVEKYDGASGELVAWVRVPTLKYNEDTVINIHFGHSSVCGATENPTGVWDSNYVGVWHLDEEQSGTGNANLYKDSTSNDNDGDDYVSATGQDGQIGGGQQFDGIDDYVEIGTTGFTPTNMTLAAWVKADALADHRYMFGHTTQPAYANRLQIYTNGIAPTVLGLGLGDTHAKDTGSALSAGSWYHVVLVKDATNYWVYLNSALDMSGTYTGFSALQTYADIGNDGNPSERTESWNGVIDEMRISNVARSADWIQTSYNNQSNPSSFYSVGTSSCWLGGFSCNRRITIDSTKVEGSSDLTNFPFLIKIQNDCNIKTAANGGGVQNSSGWDIIFTDSDGVTQLDHEIEEYDGTTGDLTAWVRIPTLPYNSDKDIYMYYGKSDLTCDPSNPTGVWDSSYEAVYHLNESTNFQDSTSHNRDATAEDTANYSAVIADGEDFGPQDEISIGNWNFSGNELTLQAWARFDDFDQDDPRVFSKANGTSEQNHIFMLGLGGNLEQHLRMRVKTGTDDLTGTTTIVDTDDPLSTGTWYLIAGTYDGSNMRLLLDGVDVHNSVKTGNLRVNSWNIALGNHPGGTSSTYSSMDGKLDEVRILSAARSADWLRTEYNNQSDPDSFSTMSQDTCGGTYGFNFQYCKKITVDHTQVSGTLTRYPLLINITGDDDLKTEANGGRVQHTQGYDIVFRTSGCGNLEHEIEKYDGVNGDLVAWVLIDPLSASTDTEIYMYYGANVICSTENPTGVWDARFRAVYHLNDDFDDSTQYNRDGTNYGATFTAGKIGNGVLFDPSDGYDRIELGTWDMSSDDITIQAWAWPNDFNQDDPRIVSKGSTTGSGTQDHVWQFGLENGDNGENRMRFRLKTGTVDTAGTVELEGTSPNGYLPTPQTWYHLAGTYEDDNSAGTEMRLYVNGLDAGQLGHAGNIAENAWPIWIGANPHGASSGAKSWDGVLDEVRILSSDLSQDWLETEYRNHNDPGNFYSITSCFEQTSEVTQEWVEEIQ